MAKEQDVAKRLLTAAATLKRLPRTGWLMLGVAQPESVADHSHAVALLALLLTEQINVDPGKQGLDGPLDVGRVLQIAVVHDLAESLVTDLPHRATRLIGKAAKHQAEAAALAEICAGWPNVERVLSLWTEYAEQTSPEARLVHDADKLELVHQAMTYAATGHRNLGEFFEGHVFHYPISAHLFAALRDGDS